MKKISLQKPKQLVSRNLIQSILFGILITGCNSVKENPCQLSNPNGRNDAWGFTGYGGGGAMFYPAVSPHNSDYAYVACDMTGSFVTTNGGKSWRMFSLRGPVKYFVFDPSDSNIVYAKSIALFKSTDHGNTWNILYPAPDEINGIVAKGDHAEERVITKDSTQRNVQALAVDPDNSLKLYAAISVNNAVGYYSSDNQGLSWKKEKDLDHSVKNIFIKPSSPGEDRTLYITGEKSVTVREEGKWRINNGPVGVGKLTRIYRRF